MPSAAPVQAERAAVLTAMTGEGQRLPVIDVTNPAFAVDDSLEAVEALRVALWADQRRRERVPKFLGPLLLWSWARRSALLRRLMTPKAGFLDSLSTYLLKLGPDNLVPPFDGSIDRRVAASPAVASVRIRLQQVARLMADGLAGDLAARSGRPLHLINIGGGPAIDSLNALVILRRSATNGLARPVVIHVLDLDAQGPAFGKNALAALAAAGGPLAGLDISLVHVPYNWNEVAPLDRLVGQLAAEDAIIAASSEGALFDYGSDEDIVANLVALNAAGRGARAVVGSVTHADELARRVFADSPFKLVPRGMDAFAQIAARGGFAVARVAPALLSDQVLLRLA